MAFHVRDPETDRLVRELARKKGIGLTEAIRDAVEEALRRERETVPLWLRIRKIAAPIAQYEETGVVTDKAFFDELSGN